jgi:carboxylesterase type B
VRQLQHQDGLQERSPGLERVFCNKCLVFATGFLKTGARGSAQGNFGLMDLVAGLHWLRENIPAFGGDAERITLMGHGTGAALSNIIAVSPVAKGRSVT